MRRISRSDCRSVRLAAILVSAGLMVALSGCGVIAKEFSDGDYAETIPAALQDSDLGVTEAFASKGLDGFTFYLSVGVDIDQAQLSDSALAEMLQIIIDGNDLPTDQMRITVQDIDGEFVELGEIVEGIAPDVGNNYVTGARLIITTDEAREIIDAVDAEQS